MPITRRSKFWPYGARRSTIMMTIIALMFISVLILMIYELKKVEMQMNDVSNAVIGQEEEETSSPSKSSTNQVQRPSNDINITKAKDKQPKTKNEKRKRKRDKDEVIHLLKMKNGDVTSDSKSQKKDVPYAYSHVFQAKIAQMVDGKVNECEEGFGFKMVKEWRSKEKDYCVGEQSNSNLKCRQYQQYLHSGKDLFCDGHNLVIDYSKVKAMTPSKWEKDGVFGEQRYYEYGQGTITAKCTIDRNLFTIDEHWPSGAFQQMYRPLFLGFQGIGDGDGDDVTCDESVDHPVLFVVRDGRWNLYHSMADFVNAFLSLEILKMDTNDLQVIILDRDLEGNYIPLWKKAFSPNYPVLHGAQMLSETGRYRNKKVCYKHAIFNIPGVSSFLCKGISSESECVNSDVLMAFGAHVIESLGYADLKSKSEPSALVPLSITIIQRKIHPEKKKMDRVFQNPEQMVEKAKEILPDGQFSIRIVDFASVDIEEQIKIVRTTDMLVGIHGAGLTHQLFMEPGSTVLEYIPGYGTHFVNIAKWMGHDYATCRYRTSDGNVPMDCWAEKLMMAKKKYIDSV